MNVLLAEDDRAVRESLVRALTLEGYAVTAVTNGAEALAHLADSTPDVLLLDVSMPVVDGLTVCRVLRSEKNRIPILMLTARTETRDRVAGLDAGADDYLPKPFDLGELLARIRALLRRETQMIRKRRDTISELAFQPVTGRLAKLILERIPSSETSTERDLTLDQIAAMVASSPEVVCRTLYQFQRGGLLRVTRASIDLHDRVGLEHLAGIE